jgi:hypothetical protein
MYKKTGILLVFLLCVILPCIAMVYARYYLPGYSPVIYNQVDYYKVNKGLEFNKTRPYLVSSFGTTSKQRLDFDSLKVVISTKIGDETIYPDVTMSLERYLESMKTKVFKKTLISEVLTVQQQATAQTGGLIKDITIDLPNIAIPKTIRRILGSKAGRLNLDGTQRITISGTSTKRKIVPIYETNRGSRFDLKMQQDTNLRLTGTIGEKIAVNLKYNSNQDETLFSPNNINIKYTGDEDEVVQSVEAGNITLSLSGSRYISYSASSQGLFGVISKLKYGPLDLTMIASKEEGQKNTMSYLGQSQADSTIIFSKNFAPRTFYFLENPYDIYDLYTNADTGIPSGWVNNAIKTTAGAWQIRYPALLPKNGSVKVYVDDGDATNNVASVPGDSIFISPTEYYQPFYDELIEGTDFVTNYSVGTIEILRNVDRLHTIAVKYVRSDDIPVPEDSNVQDGYLHTRVLRARNQEYDPSNPYSTWNYQMRNIYSMGITNIKKDDFQLEVYTENTDRTRNYNVPDSLAASTTFNDYLLLDSNGDGRVNGDDDTVNLASGYVVIPMIRPFYPLADTLIYQEESENISYTDFRHFISVKGKIGRDMISLGQTGILPGSVKVKVNGSSKKENIDYIVDYDMGQITFLTAEGKDPDARIEIDYEYRSGFAVARKTLIGLRTDWNITDNTKLGGTFIYRSETVAEKRPKIGNENIELVMANIDGSATFKPGFVTRWIDALPLIKTSAESRIALSAEIAVTMPEITGDNQNKKQAYIDDMEGIIDSYPMGLAFSTWVTGSKPWQTSLPKARINWYNPTNIRMRQVYDEITLNDAEKDDIVNILALKVVPNVIVHPDLSSWSYGGVMKYMGNQLDFSNKKYIELLVKVDKYDEGSDPNITLHVDLGDINEDFYTDYGGLNVLNSEDKNNDGVLSASEDTGLDGIPDGQPGDDPNDQAESTNPDDNVNYKNGTEKNGLLDTEDLDNNGVLSQLDRYLSYSVSITNTDASQNPYLIEYNSNRFMLIRIPLDQTSAYTIVNNSSSGIQPSLKKVSYLRLWAETDKAARILIASASLVGNKWEDFHIRNLNNSIINPITLNANNESYLSGIVDNQKNATHYTSPRKTFITELNKPTLEQALTLKTENLQPGHRVLLRQRIVDFYSLLSYGRLLLWAYPENAENHPLADNDSIDIIFRLGADSLNYYQVRQPVRIIPWQTKMQENDWLSLEYDLQDFSRIKDSLAVDEEQYNNGRFFSYKGYPTLTNVREFTLGLQRNPDSSTPFTGTAYFNDIRVADPFEDMGWAGRVSLNTVLADFSTFDVEYEQKSENFNPNIQRGRTQSFAFSSSNSLKISNKYFLDKLFPLTWGLRIPIALDRNHTLSIPRYRANSDVLRSRLINPEDKERERSENLTYTATVGLSQTAKPNSALLAYTLNKMSLSGRISNTINNTATARDTTLAWQATWNYNFNLPENTLSYKLIKNYKINLIPGGFTNNITYNYSDPKSYNWELRDSLRTWYPRAQVFPIRNLNTDNGITWALLSDLNTNYRLMTKRDFTLLNYFQNYNVGKETEYNQEIGANYTPNYLPDIFTLSNSITSRYTENQRKYTNTVAGEQVYTYLKDGNATRTLRVNLSLMNSNLFRNLAVKMTPSATKRTTESDKGPAGSTVPKQDMQEGIDSKDVDWELKEKLLAEEKEKQQKLDDPDCRNPESIKEEYEEKKETEEGIKDEVKDTDISDKDADVKTTEEKSGTFDNINLPYRFISFLSQVKNITATYQNGFSQVYTSKTRRPNYYFQIGLPHQVSDAFLDSRTLEDTYTLSSGITFSRRIDSTVNYSYALSKRYANASNQSISVTFPDIGITVSDLEALLGLSKYLGSTRLTSGYQNILRQNGDIDWIKPKQETRTTSFNPLASITTNVTRNLQATLSVTMSDSDNITDMTTYNIVRKSTSQGLTGNVSYAFQSSKGIELPFTNRRINIRNELTSSLGISYDKNYDTTRGLGTTQVDRHSSRISFTPTATYQFDQNIKGGLTSGYELSTDKKRDDATRIFRLGIWVEITL